jgi:hypothetical protein
MIHREVVSSTSSPSKIKSLSVLRKGQVSGSISGRVGRHDICHPPNEIRAYTNHPSGIENCSNLIGALEGLNRTMEQVILVPDEIYRVLRFH